VSLRRSSVRTWLRTYWSALLLAFAAIAFLSLSVPTKEAMTGAGFALLGGAITRSIDIAKERSAELERADAARRKDLDETRRLAYAALVAHESLGSSVFVATLVNALAHGSAVDPDVAARHVQELLNSLDPDAESRRWLEDQIARMNAELDSSPPPQGR
jgi:hypothetical protein